MGAWDSFTSALGSFASGVGSTVQSILTNPVVQNTGAQLLQQYVTSKQTPRVAPSPYAYQPVTNTQLMNPYSAYYNPAQAGTARQIQARSGPGRVVATPQAYPTQLQNRLARGAPGAVPMSLSAGDILTQAGRGIMDVLLPSGGSPVPAFPGMDVITSPGTYGGGVFGEVAERVTGAIAGRPSMFAYGQTRARALPMLEAVHPETGKVHYWRHLGRPILFTGDLAVCKRVSRVRGKLNRGRPRPR